MRGRGVFGDTKKMNVIFLLVRKKIKHIRTLMDVLRRIL